MDPQLEEYRRRQRERAASQPKNAKPAVYMSWFWVAAIVAVAGGLIAVNTGASSGLTGGSRRAGGPTCPVPTGLGMCIEECSADADCESQGKLCCSTGCGHACMNPEVEQYSTDEKKTILMVTLKRQNEDEDHDIFSPRGQCHSVAPGSGCPELDEDCLADPSMDAKCCDQIAAASKCMGQCFVDLLVTHIDEVDISNGGVTKIHEACPAVEAPDAEVLMQAMGRYQHMKMMRRNRRSSSGFASGGDGFHMPLELENMKNHKECFMQMMTCVKPPKDGRDDAMQRCKRVIEEGKMKPNDPCCKIIGEVSKCLGETCFNVFMAMTLSSGRPYENTIGAMSRGCRNVKFLSEPEMKSFMKSSDMTIAKPGTKGHYLVKEPVAAEVLNAIPNPSSFSHLQAVGIITLEYAAGRSSDACAAESALSGHKAVQAVEYDGSAPSCAKDGKRSSGSGSRHAGNEWSDEVRVDEDMQRIWNRLLEQDHIKHDEHLRKLSRLGEPDEVSTKVVAGDSYEFHYNFRWRYHNAEVTVVHQRASDSLDVTSSRLPTSL